MTGGWANSKQLSVPQGQGAYICAPAGDEQTAQVSKKE